MAIKNNFSLVSTLILMLIFVSCQNIKRQIVIYKTEVDFYEGTSIKKEKLNKIVINRIKKKPSSFVSVANDNITENLRFHLLNLGFVVNITNVKEKESLASTELLDLEPSRILELIRLNNSDLLIDGFLYEKNTGNILDETISTGIVLKAYNKNGLLVGKFVLNSTYTTEEFESNFILSGLLAKKISDVLKNNNKNSFNILNYFK